MVVERTFAFYRVLMEGKCLLVSDYVLTHDFMCTSCFKWVFLFFFLSFLGGRRGKEVLLFLDYMLACSLLVTVTTLYVRDHTFVLFLFAL